MMPLPDPWLRYRQSLALSAWVAGLTLIEFWAALTGEAAKAAVATLPHHHATLRLVALNGHRLDVPEEFHR